MRYFIYGYYGFGNFGDDLMLSAIVHQIRRRDPHAAFTVKCRDAVAGLGSGVSFLYADRILERDAPAWRRAIAYGTTLWRGLRGHDRLVIGGGALFLDKGGINKSLLFLLMLAWCACLARVPIALIGVSCDQLAHPVSLWLSRAIFQRARWVTVRDAYSRDYARYFGRSDAALCADLAFASPDLPPSQPMDRAGPMTGRRRIGVCLIDYFAVYEPDAALRQRFLASFADALRTHAADTDYVYLSLQAGQGLHDERLYDELSRSVVFAERRLLRSGGEAMDVLRELDGVVTMRYHLGLLAQAAGKPVVAIVHEMKMATLAEGPGVSLVSLARLTSGGAGDPISALDGIDTTPMDWSTLLYDAERNFAWCEQSTDAVALR